ncbi:GntR family transcriptional regulator [Achromobacter seleniivolatilans]|uniref:GntR family transcriptional regulator n=1 Tax=Achromobacter seleniivolatilans TaxID=3047478 RepID=A0ABY9LVM3_9BURK|nr:GntR family transcriptional regulator [Achromobacter sp. R39]WMD18817.1 GntR family transcriptional regulator [Achromobacter sp. R39]
MDIKAPATIPYFLQEQIRELIVDGTIRPGQPLREQELEQRFGTSRSPIREALRLLELGGLVSHIQRKGFRVTLYTEAQIRHLYQLRAELEAYCFRQVAETADLSPLVAELRSYDDAIAASMAKRDIRASIAASREFYLAAARYTGNTPLVSMLSKLYEQVEPLRYLLAKRSMETNNIQSYTQGITQALSERNFDRAAELSRGYVVEVLPGILQAYHDAALQDAEDLAPRYGRA